MKLIDKSTVVAEIKRLIRKNEAYLDDNVTDAVRSQKTSAYSVLNEVLHFIDTLEVKEVDLEKIARHYLLHEHVSPLNEVLHQADLYTEMQYHKDIENAYKAGVELGLKVQKGE